MNGRIDSRINKLYYKLMYNDVGSDLELRKNIKFYDEDDDYDYSLIMYIIKIHIK